MMKIRQRHAVVSQKLARQGLTPLVVPPSVIAVYLGSTTTTVWHQVHARHVTQARTPQSNRHHVGRAPLVGLTMTRTPQQCVWAVQTVRSVQKESCFARLVRPVQSMQRVTLRTRSARRVWLANMQQQDPPSAPTVVLVSTTMWRQVSRARHAP